MYPCMITGEEGNCERVVTARIAPAVLNVKKLYRLVLTFDDIHSIRNGLLLAKSFEEAFDQLRLSFVHCVIPEEKVAPRICFKLKIWDSESRLIPIWKDSQKLIGDYDDHALNLRQHKTFKRALSYQANQRFLHFPHMFDSSEQPPLEYRPDNPSAYYMQMKQMFDIVVRDIEEEADDIC